MARAEEISARGRELLARQGGAGDGSAAAARQVSALAGRSGAGASALDVRTTSSSPGVVAPEPGLAVMKPFDCPPVELGPHGEVLVTGDFHIPRLKGLEPALAKIEAAAIHAVKTQLPAFIESYIDAQRRGLIDPKVISADEAKNLFSAYNPPRRDETDLDYKQRQREARAIASIPINAAADAVEKALFVIRLQQLEAQGISANVLVTSGGPGAGKTHAIQNLSGAGGPAWMRNDVDLVLDLQGESAGTKLQWALEQCEKYGHRMGIVHVEADVVATYKNQAYGILPRTAASGRTAALNHVVNAYRRAAEEAERFRAWQEQSPSPSFLGMVVIQNGSPPTVVPHGEVSDTLRRSAALREDQALAEASGSLEHLESLVAAQMIQEAQAAAEQHALSAWEHESLIEAWTEKARRFARTLWRMISTPIGMEDDHGE